MVSVLSPLFVSVWARKSGSKVQDGGSVDLRGARFDYTQDEADLPHGRFLIVIKGHDHAFAFRQPLDRVRQPLTHLSVQIEK